MKLEAKIRTFLEVGTWVGILVNLGDHRVRGDRVGQEAVTLQDGEVLTVPEVLPGWDMVVSELWPPVFD